MPEPRETHDDSLSPERIVRAFYAAFADRDEFRLRELLADDVEWNQCEGFPGGARRRGIEDVLEGVFRGNRQTWDGFAAPIEDSFAAGDRVVVLGHYEGRHRETGRSMRASFAHVYRVRENRIVHFQQIADTWPMVAAMGKAPDP